MSESKSPRRVMLETLKEELKKRNRDGRRYFIKRGSIAWPQFPFEKHPLAISIGLDDTALKNRRNGFIPATITIEMAAKMTSEKEDPSFDEGIQDDLLDDAVKSMEGLQAARTGSNNDPVIFDLKWETASASEFHDSRFLVQGVIVTFDVSY